jgi:hypothetical protein
MVYTWMEATRGGGATSSAAIRSSAAADQAGLVFKGDAQLARGGSDSLQPSRTRLVGCTVGLFWLRRGTPGRGGSSSPRASSSSSGSGGVSSLAPPSLTVVAEPVVHREGLAIPPAAVGSTPSRHSMRHGVGPDGAATSDEDFLAKAMRRKVVENLDFTCINKS